MFLLALTLACVSKSYPINLRSDLRNSSIAIGVTLNRFIHLIPTRNQTNIQTSGFLHRRHAATPPQLR